MPVNNLNLGNVLSQAENINTGRRRNELLDRQAQPDSVFRQTEQANLTGKQQSNRRGQDAQSLSDLQILNTASAELRTNADAYPRWRDQLIRIDPSLNLDGKTPEDISFGANKIFESTSQALQAQNQRVGGQSKPTSDIQNFGFFQNLSKENKKIFMDLKRAAPGANFLDTGSQIEVRDKSDGSLLTTIEKGIAPEKQPDFVASVADAKDKVKNKEKNEKAAKLKGTTARLIDEILSDQDSIRALVGPLDQVSPTFQSNTLKARTKIEQLKSILTADNLGIMSGVLSETDIKIIEKIAGGGLDVGGDDSAFIEELIRMKASLNSENGGKQRRLSDNQPTEGQTATNPATGQTITFVNGAWQ